MDKKNTIIGVSLLIAAFAVFLLGPKSTPTQTAPEITRTAGPNQAHQVPVNSSPADAAFASVAADVAEAKTFSLSNDFVEVTFTNYGGAVRDIALRKYDADKKNPGVPYVINHMRAAPALAFNDLPGLDRNAAFELVSQSATEIVFRAVWENRVEVTRKYTLTPGAGSQTADPYVLRYETSFRNLTDSTVQMPRAQFSVGTSAPLNVEDLGAYLSTGYHSGTDTKLIARSDLEGGGFLSGIGIGNKTDLPSIETAGSLNWVSAQNQFFVSILMPDEAASGMVTRRVELPPFHGSSKPAIGVTGIARFDVPALAPKGTAKLSGSLYSGPKEYKRLSNSDVFKYDQDKLMDFGFFKFFSQILLTLMSWIHAYVPSWGWSIVLTTLLLKIVFLPLTLAASKSAKRMAKIQPEMAAVREKWKENPQKLQVETMELFKKHKVNPMGGCLPILITIPFFIGFFKMLQSTAELRFQEFFWAIDLSAPDTVGHLWGFPINIFPVLMGATMVIQTHLTPTPTVDNMQAKMMKFMPYFFALICYNFSCALALYSTVNGLFTIGQQLIINRMKDPVGDAAEAALAAEAAKRGGRKMRNVTPGK